MNKKLARLLAVLVLVAAAGCRRHTHPPSIGGAPRPVWSAGDITTIEGRKVTLTLRLSRISDSDSDISIDVSNEFELSAPDSVTIPAGSETASVTVIALAVDEAPDVDPDTGDVLDAHDERSPFITASTANGSSTVQFHILEEDGETGPAAGPVAAGSGVALLSGAGADGKFGTGDEELITATGVGTGAPVLNKLKIGFLSGDASCLPVIGPGGEALLLGSAPVVTLTQVQSIPSAPTITATLSLAGKPGGISSPVIIGGRAVMTSRGLDLTTSLDDTLLIVQGIGTATLTVKTVSMPGIAAGDPSIPVALDATSLLIVTSGADFLFGTGDEILAVVRNLDAATPTVTPIFSGAIRGDASGRPMASGGTIAAVETAGLDGLFSTSDDRLQVIRDVLGTPTPAPPVAIGGSVAGPAGMPIETGSDAAIVPSLGADLLPGTADDEVVVVSLLSVDPMTNTVVAAPYGTASPAGVLVLMSGSSAVRLSAGPDGTQGTADDTVVILASIPAAPTTSSFLVGPVANFAPLPADGTSIVMSGVGPDHIAGTTDDLTLRLSGIGGGPVLTNNPTGPFAPQSAPALIPIPTGFSLAGVTSGIDETPANADDRLSANIVP
ncbi:MAG: hypothetical protein K8T20_20925 [Planctomycetes bacterium]|nr:hypothetical protein [Planctomycetota bacterium]